MKYRVSIDEREREVDVILEPSGRARVTLDGAPVDADVERVPSGLSLLMGGRVYDLVIGGPPEATQVASRAQRGRVAVVSERMKARSKKSGAMTSGQKEIRAPMPGRVVAVLVAAGQEVAAGAPCVVVEAMKMENELLAPIGGVVAEVHVEVGVSVEGRALLVTFG